MVLINACPPKITTTARPIVDYANAGDRAAAPQQRRLPTQPECQLLPREGLFGFKSYPPSSLQTRSESGNPPVPRRSIVSVTAASYDASQRATPADASHETPQLQG
jgi:hypothetical protein